MAKGLRAGMHRAPGRQAQTATPVRRLSGGQALQPETRARMESRFGWNFADVRVHADNDQAARVGAAAFTIGRDIALAPGAPGLGAARGEALLAHELAHVVQQDRGAEGVAPSGNEALLEAEARTAGRSGGEPAQVSGAAAPMTMQCQTSEEERLAAAAAVDAARSISTVSGSYNKVHGDHVHQVAARTSAPGADRESAEMFKTSDSVSTKESAGYGDKAGQRVERAFNAALWGRDNPGLNPVAKGGQLRITATGATTVGDTAGSRPAPAVPSQSVEDLKSYYKLREAGVAHDKALNLVLQSRESLQAGGATPARVPIPAAKSRGLPAGIKAGEPVSQEMPARDILGALARSRARSRAGGFVRAPGPRSSNAAGLNLAAQKTTTPTENEPQTSRGGAAGAVISEAANTGAAALRSYDAYRTARDAGKPPWQAALAAQRTYLDNTNPIYGILANYRGKMAAGLDAPDAVVTTAGETLAGFVAPGSSASQAVNAGANLVAAADEHHKRGQPKAPAGSKKFGVGDAANLVSEFTPGTATMRTLGAGARAYLDIGRAIGGDPKAVDRFGDDVAKGVMGPVLQPLGMTASFFGNLGSGEGATKALDKTLAASQDSPLARAGNALGDAAWSAHVAGAKAIDDNLPRLQAAAKAARALLPW